MEQTNEGVPSIWRSTESDKRQRPPESSWLKTSSPDGKSGSIESPRINRLLSADVEVYTLAWSFPGYMERLLFVFGMGSQIGFAVTCSVLVSRYVRRRFFLSGRMADFTSAYGATSMAVLATAFANDRVIVQKLYYGDGSRLCFPCQQVKQAALNIATSLLLPATVLLPESLYHALGDRSYGGVVPRITEGKRTWQFIAEKYGGVTLRKLGWMSLASVAVTTVGTYMQLKAAVRISMSVDDDPTILNEVAQQRHETMMYRLSSAWNGFWSKGKS